MSALSKFPRRLLREPVFHFLVAGACIFVLARYAPSAPVAQPRHVEVTAADLARIQKNFQIFAGRAPRPEELEQLVQDYVLDEIMVREALDRGLDKGDTQIRQRLREKMQFVLEADKPQPEPTDAQLAEYLAKNAEYYQFPPQISFKQIFLSPSLRQEHLQSDAEALLEKLRAEGPDATPQGAGDPIPLPAEYRRAAVSRVELMFGKPMVEQLLKTELNQWQGPFESDLGLHLALVAERLESRVPDLEEVRDAVRREWLAEDSARRQEEAQEKLKGLYTISIAPMPKVTDKAKQAAAKE